MPNITNYPPQGIQAEVDLLYLYSDTVLNKKQNKLIPGNHINIDEIDPEHPIISAFMNFQDLLGNPSDNAALNGVLTQINNDIANETTRATEAEGELNRIIGEEVTRATEAEEALGQRIADEIAAEKTRAEGAESALGTRITDEIATEKERAEGAENSLGQRITDEIAVEKSRAEGAESALGTRITDEIAEEKERAENAESALDSAMVKEAIVPNVQVSTSLIQSADAASIKITSKNTDTGVESSTETPFNIASSAQLGLMPKEAYAQLQTNTDDISTLKGRITVYSVSVGENPSQSELQSAYEAAAQVSAGTVPPNNTTLVNVDNKHDYTYYANTATWTDMGLSRVQTATQTALGIVKGSTDNGKVFVESDGAMSLNGYDTLTTDISNNSSAIQTEKGRAEGAESALGTRITDEIAAEKERAEGAESALGTRITDEIAAEKSRAEGVEGTLSDSITAEKTRAEGAEGSLGTRITDETTRAAEAEEANADNIATINGKIPTTASATNKLVDKSQMDAAILVETNRATVAEEALENSKQANLPSGQDGQVLSTNGTDLSWITRTTITLRRW